MNEHEQLIASWAIIPPDARKQVLTQIFENVKKV